MNILWKRIKPFTQKVSNREGILIFLRILLGSIFIVSAVLKIPHQSEFVQIVISYGIMPSNLAGLYGLLLPWAELIIGCLLVLGIFVRLASAISLAMVFSFIIANLYAVLGFSAETNNLCGCFGAAMPLSHEQSLTIDILMLVISFTLLMRPSRFLSLNPSPDRSVLARLSSLVLVTIMFTTMFAPASTQTVIAAQPESDSEVLVNEEPAAVDTQDEVKPVLRFFYSDWCHYCQEQKPVIGELEEEYAGNVTFVYLNTGEDRDVVAEWAIKSIPTIILSVADTPDTEQSRYEGLTEKEVLQSGLDALFNRSADSTAIPPPDDTASIAPEQIGAAETGESSSVDIDREIDVALINGMPVFLFFYAEWCHYCQEQHPVIDELEEAYGGDIAFLRAESSEYTEALTEWGVTGFPSMFLIVDRENGSYVYQEFGGFTGKDVLDASFSQLVTTGSLPEDALQTGYVHHSCDRLKCYEHCIVKKFKYPSLASLEATLFDFLLDCTGAQAAQDFLDAYATAKAVACLQTCGEANTPREWGNCVQCAISETFNKIPLPLVGCVFDLWGFLGDMLKPHSDCLEECASDSSTWEENWGHPCRDHHGSQSRCANSNVMEELECQECSWVVTKVTTCDDGCEEIPKIGAACKDKCKEIDCDDGDDCTTDFCIDGECFHEQIYGEGCACPADCDDGNRCTTDYCDDIGMCQHTRISGCCPTSCNDGDRCTRDWCDGNGSCRHARIPGCDHPDDNQDYSTPPEYDVLPEDDASGIAVLNNGFADDTLNIIGETGGSAALIDPSLQGLHNFNVLIIPSGGFSGLDTSDLFRERLWSYVENGGTLISFAQQHGAEFAVLPGGEVTGYGWQADQACQTRSVGLTEYHPVLSGQRKEIANFNVDGFFTSHSENASVLLTRIKNGMPAMILYDYGEGMVLASTLYTDMAESLYQQSRNERTFMRDLLAWAEAESNIPTYAPGNVELSILATNPQTGAMGDSILEFDTGDMVSVTIDVTNTHDTFAANTVNFTLYDPHFNPYTIVVPATIAARETQPVTFNYQTAADAESGVWQILYVLYSGDEVVAFDYGGEFALGYHIAELSQFQAYVTVTSPDGDIILDTGMPLDIPPGETSSIDIDFQAGPLGIWSARYSVLSSNDTVLMSSSQPFAVSNWAENPEGWGYQGTDINFSVTSDADSYADGALANFTIHLWNRSDTARTVTCWFSFPHNCGKTHDYNLYGGGITNPWNISTLFRTLSVPAQGPQGTPGYASFDYSVPVYSTDRLWAQFLEGDETSAIMLGGASRGFFSVSPRVAVNLYTNQASYAQGEDIQVTAVIANSTRIALDLNTEVSLIDADGTVLAQEVLTATLAPYASAERTLTLSIPGDAVSGEYQVSAQTYSSGILAGGTAVLVDISRPYSASLSLDKPDSRYTAGETMHISLTLSNMSYGPWEDDVHLDVPAAGFSASGNISVPGGTATTENYTVPLPAGMSAGTYPIILIILSVPTDGYTLSEYFVIPASNLVPDLLESSFIAGENITVNLTNDGGVGTTAECTGDLYWHGATTQFFTPDLLPGQTVPLSLPIPVSVPTGTYYVGVHCQDTGTARSVHFSSPVSIQGSDLELSLDETACNAGGTVDVSLTNTGAIATTADCSLKLEDSHGYTVEDDGVYPVSASETISIPLTVPDQAASGIYRLTASCTDTYNLRVSRLRENISVSGFDTTLTSVTDKTIYLDDEDISIQTYVANSEQEFSDGTLNLKIWRTWAPPGGPLVGWTDSYDNSVGDDVANAVTVDDAGNVYVTGESYGTNAYDYATIKYDAGGTRLWVARYNGVGNDDDVAEAIAVDSAGNVYVTGSSINGTYRDYVTIKYDSDGNQLWVAQYNGDANRNDEAEAIAVDGDGNVYVTGLSTNAALRADYATVKYNSLGVRQWVARYNSYRDSARAIVVDDAGNVYVTGESYSGLSNPDYLTVKYDSLGVQQWTARYDGTGARYDYARLIAVDDDGNVYVAGESDDYTHEKREYATIKYDYAGNELWAARYGGSGDYFWAYLTAMEVDTDGNVYVTGYDEDFSTVKYDSEGTELWADDWDGPLGGRLDEAYALAVDGDGNVYVTGASWDDDDHCYATLKYDSAGNLVQETRYGSEYGDDRAFTYLLTVDGYGNASTYIVGETEVPLGTGSDYLVRAYTPQTDVTLLLWEKDIPVSLSALEVSDIITNVNIPGELPGITGKLHHDARLYNSDGQVVEESETQTFYIAETDLTLTMDTNLESYRPGEQVLISGEVYNGAPAPDDGTLVVTVDGGTIYTDSFTLQPGETQIYNTSMTAMDTFLLQASVDGVTVSDSIEVVPYGVNVEIIAPDVTGLAPFDATLLIENNSDNDYIIDVSFAGSTWDNLELLSGNVSLLDTTLSITGDTVLSAVLSGDVIMTTEKTVVMGEAATLQVTPEASYDPGTAEIPFTVNNTGLINIEFEATFALGGQTVVRALYVPSNSMFVSSVALDLTTGVHNLTYSSPYGSGAVSITVTGEPEFIVTEEPDNLALIAGEQTWNFTVENIGESGGFLEFSLMLPDWEDIQFAWLEAGKETVLSFVFEIPDDLEDSTYQAFYEINEQQHSLEFSVQGPKVTVVPSLDKDLYNAGDNATLTLLVTNISPFDLDLFARMQLGDYEAVEDFSLAASGADTILQYNVPVDFDSGKLFFGIYAASGRALHLNALYVYERQLLGLWTDRQIYDMGDTVTVYMDAPYAGTVNITAPGYTDLIALPAGVSTTQFTLPALTTGTHYIEYTFDGTTSRYPFDVRGYTGRITNFRIDKGSYQAGDDMRITATAEVNPAVDGVMRCLILDHWGSTVSEFETPVTLITGNNVIEVETVFNSISSGLHSVQCQIQVEVPGQSLMLASASQYFDAIGVNEMPIPDAGIPYYSVEGCNVIFDAGDSYDLNNDSMQYRWDFDSDAIWDTDWSTDPTASNVWPDDWNGLTTLQVTDGGLSVTDTVEVVIENMPPIVTAGDNQTVNRWETVYFSGSFTDYGILDTHTIIWDFGDGTTDNGTLTPTHSYNTQGIYTVSLTVTDDDGGIGNDTLEIMVEEGQQPLPGDANNDGDINIFDMTKVARIILELDDPTHGADANQDGSINIFDMTKIARIILELD